MKVLFSAEYPFAWADGGASILCERIMDGLIKIGIQAEPVRWWDRHQVGDILQVFGSVGNAARYAAAKGLRVYSYAFLDGVTSQSKLGLLIRQARIAGMCKLSPSLADQAGMRMREFVSGFVVPSLPETSYLNSLYGVDINKVRVILHGVDEIYRQSAWVGGSDYLVSVGTICRRKNSLELARLANRLRIPIQFIGRLQDTDHQYISDFLHEALSPYVKYHEGLDDHHKLKIMERARAFILLSRGESGCIAALEALAMGMPIILPTYTWATAVYKDHAWYVSMRSKESMRRDLSKVYNAVLTRSVFPVSTWTEVAAKYHSLYTDLT